MIISAGINSTLEDWRTFLTQTLTGALAAPHDLFRKVKTESLQIYMYLFLDLFKENNVTEEYQLKSSFVGYSKSCSPNFLFTGN